MVSKSSFVLLFAVSLVAAASITAVSSASALQSRANNSSHHLIVGRREAGDHLLSQQVVFKSSSFLSIVNKEVVFSTPNRQIITLVRALDQKTNGNGAYASITKGGPGNQNVTVYFKSQRGHSISFLLEIYGR